MFPREASETLESVDALRRLTRRAVGPPWVALVCFGTATALSAAVILAAPVGLVVFWPLAGVVGGVAIRQHMRRESATSGVVAPASRWHLALAMFFVCFVLAVAASAVFGRTAVLIVPMIAILVGYAVLGVLHHDPRIPAVVAVAVAVGVAAAVSRPRSWIVELVFGAALVLAGVALRRTARA